MIAISGIQSNRNLSRKAPSLSDGGCEQLLHVQTTQKRLTRRDQRVQPTVEAQQSVVALHQGPCIALSLNCQGPDDSCRKGHIRQRE